MRRKEILERLDSDGGLTAFQKKVLTKLMDVPRGQTVTYKKLAAMAGRPRAYRAVGTAVRKNPLAPYVPCHRVIRSDGGYGNYSGKGGRQGKIRMLREEGAIRQG
jgi:methylated-DNA-[protein]-cysteine S-methyltransferase